MQRKRTLHVLAHTRQVCEYLERNPDLALPSDLLDQMLGVLGEMLGYEADDGSSDKQEGHPAASLLLPLPSVEGMMDALLDARAYERPVSATDVARALWRGEHGHSELCRVGQRLRMMAAFGMVIRHPGDSHRGNRWSLVASA